MKTPSIDRVSATKSRRDQVWFDCECETPEHAFRMNFDRESKTVWVSTCLHPGPGFWFRLKAAVNYVLRFDPSRGDDIFEDTVLSVPQVWRLKQHVDEFLVDIEADRGVEDMLP